MSLAIRSQTLRRRLSCSAAALVLVAAVSAQATVHHGTINGDEAQATTCSAGSTSQIVGTVTYDDVTGLFSWSYVYGDNAPAFDDGDLFGGGTETFAHFHGPAPPGFPSGTVQVGVPIGNPNSGSATITPAQGAELLAELYYLNVHSTTCVSGELRGQVLFPAPSVPSVRVPVALGLVASLALLSVAMLRRREAEAVVSDQRAR